MTFLGTRLVVIVDSLSKPRLKTDRMPRQSIAMAERRTIAIVVISVLLVLGIGAAIAVFAVRDPHQ